MRRAVPKAWRGGSSARKDGYKKQNKVRLEQYISMMPAEKGNQQLRDWRITSWKNRVAPEGYAFPGDPRNWERDKYDTATLTALGEKLLGLKSW